MTDLFSNNIHLWYMAFSLFISLLAPLLFLRFLLPVIRKIITKNNKILFKSLVDIKFFYSFGYFIAPVLLFILFSNYNLNELNNVPKELMFLKTDHDHGGKNQGLKSKVSSKPCE